MPEEKIITEIEKLKEVIKSSLIDLTKHLEHLSKDFRRNAKNSEALRCIGYMRTLSAMLRGIDRVQVQSLKSESVSEQG